MKNAVHLISGPNLNLLELRDSETYGGIGLDQLVEMVRGIVAQADLDLLAYQSNSESELINYLQDLATKLSPKDGIIINPAAYSHTSIALLDSLELIKCPIIEVHLSNLAKREEFRRISITAAAASGVIYGFGPYGYELAATALIQLIKR